MPDHIIGLGAVVNSQGQVLIDQRLENAFLGGFWEFPGGKQKKGERIELTIAREIREELGIEVEVGKCLINYEFDYGVKKLNFIVHICKHLSGEPTPYTSQEVRWISFEQFDLYKFPPANDPIISALIEYLEKTK